MFPSSSDSVGILSSIRMLEDGSLQIVLPAIGTELEQCPLRDDPFTDADSAEGEVMRAICGESKGDQDSSFKIPLIMATTYMHIADNYYKSVASAGNKVGQCAIL